MGLRINCALHQRIRREWRAAAIGKVASLALCGIADAHGNGCQQAVNQNAELLDGYYFPSSQTTRVVCPALTLSVDVEPFSLETIIDLAGNTRSNSKRPSASVLT